MGVSPPNPRPRNAVERIFGVCHNTPHPFFQQPMIAMVRKKFLAGRFSRVKFQIRFLQLGILVG